jgi:hypothetical protein
VDVLSKVNAGYRLLANDPKYCKSFQTLDQLPIYLTSVIFVIVSENNDNYGVHVTGKRSYTEMCSMAHNFV